MWIEAFHKRVSTAEGVQGTSKQMGNLALIDILYILHHVDSEHP
jgi:hypothetical protein